MKKYLAASLMLCAFAGSAFAADTTCKSQASEKKLAGAALDSFMKKCEADAATACDADSKAKKLAGAALDAHMKKCINDKVGAAEVKTEMKSDVKADAKPAAPAAKPAEAAKPDKK